MSYLALVWAYSLQGNPMIDCDQSVPHQYLVHTLIIINLVCVFSYSCGCKWVGSFFVTWFLERLKARQRVSLTSKSFLLLFLFRFFTPFRLFLLFVGIFNILSNCILSGWFWLMDTLHTFLIVSLWKNLRLFLMS